MRYGGYVGRVGALAVALGIGSAVAAPAGIAWATGDDSTTSSTTSGTDTATGTTESPAGAPTVDEPKTAEPVYPKSGSTTTEQVATRRDGLQFRRRTFRR